MTKLDNIFQSHIMLDDTQELVEAIKIQFKQETKALFQELIAECEYETPDEAIDAPTFKQVDGNKLKQLIEEL